MVRLPPSISISSTDFGYTTYADKPIIGLDDVESHIDGMRLAVPTSGVITYGFFAGTNDGGVNNNPVYFGEGIGYTPFSDAQKAAAIADIQLWDDIVPMT